MGQVDFFSEKATREMSTLNEKKILLVHPLGYRAEAAARDIARKANIMPPLGLASIAAYLNRRGMDSYIIDCYARPDSDGLVRDYLLNQRPRFMGLSCTTSSFLDGIRLTRLAKSILPGIQVVFGGHHVSALKERILEDFPPVDFAVVGEGEETLAELVERGGEEAASIR